LLGFLKSLVAQLGQFLAFYGGWGLLGISFLDSCFVPLPGLNDLLLLHLSSQNPERAVFYALASTIGSVAGSYVMYGLARGGSRLFWRRRSSPAFQRAQHWLERNDFASIVVASVLPPPSPFKIFLLAAGALRVNGVRFGTALLVGRGLRFGGAAFLGARYGAQAEGYLKQNLGWVSLVAALLVVAWTILYRRLASRPVPADSKDTPRSSPSIGS
jgi:membrane protein YqaA with SNARE-associated domain